MMNESDEILESYLRIAGSYTVRKIPALKPNERMIWYIDCGTMPPVRARAHIEMIKNSLLPSIVLKGETREQHIFTQMDEKYNIGAKIVIIDDDTNI